VSEAVDWRAVLKSYMRTVVDSEGISFVGEEAGPLKDVENELTSEAEAERAAKALAAAAKRRTELLAGQVIPDHALADKLVTEEEITALGFVLDPFGGHFWRRHLRQTA
jgi:4'-phosphopantetheinyl transferase EntD